LFFHVFLVSIAYEVDVFSLLFVPFLVTVDGVEGLLLFEIVKPSAFIFSFDVWDIGSFLELKLFPLDSLEERMGLYLIDTIGA
jgi:hypothetical protein